MERSASRRTRGSHRLRTHWLTTSAPVSTIEALPEDVAMSSTRLERLTRAFQQHVDMGHIPGAITAVARHGRLVHFETYGNMDAEAGKPVAPDTIFRINSMTKW